LAAATASTQSFRLTGKGTLLKNQIPVRVFRARDGENPGFCETDTASRDGGGEITPYYARTVTVTDAAPGRTGVRALKNKARSWTLQDAGDIYDAFPVPVRGIDSDGGGGFVNRYFKKRCEERGIAFTRGRSCHSDDNCFVEQKNGGVVRKTVGYARFGGDEALSALRNVYSCLNPPANCFYPAKKPVAKDKPADGKIKKVYGKRLKTPCQRLPEHKDISDTLKERVRLTGKSPDMVRLRESLEEARYEPDRTANKNRAAPSLGGRNG
jgi:hypothetical protein